MKRATRNGYAFCRARALNPITALVLSALRGFFFLKAPQDLSFVVWISLEENCDNYELTREEK